MTLGFIGTGALASAIVTGLKSSPAIPASILVRPAERVTKAVPIPPVANREGATLVYPPDSATAGVFGPLGKVFEIPDEAQLNALTAATATFAGYFRYLDTIDQWLQARGVPHSTARPYVAALFRALAHAADRGPEVPFMDLAGEYATRGGINEQLLHLLTTRGLFDALEAGLDAVHGRIAGPGDSRV